MEEDTLTEDDVALYTSAWIEMAHRRSCGNHLLVALYTSAWIEMRSTVSSTTTNIVALYTSAWIEMAYLRHLWRNPQSRTLHECVD